MPFEKTYNLIQELENLPSTNDKEELLKTALENKTFEKTVKYALSQGWTYNIGDVPTHSKPLKLEHADELFEYLDYLREKGSANEQDKIQLSRLSSDSEHTMKIINLIVKKDLRCGVGLKTVNKIKKGVIHLVPYQRCSTESKIKNIKYPALAQKKADSMFSYSLPFKETGKFLTRGGIYFDVHNPVINKETLDITDGKEVLIGELQVLDENFRDVLSRKIGNGILNSVIQGTATQEQMDRVIYDVWDLIPYEAFLEHLYKVNIVHRFKTVCERSKNIRGDAVQVIPYKYVSNEEEAREFYRVMRKNGYEGVILKNFSDYWKFNTSTKQIKLKNQSVAEFVIVDAYYGKPEHDFAEILGGITVRSSCSGIVSNCGGGFSKDERELGVQHWKDKAGSIVSIKFESVIDDKTKRMTKKLYSPQFDELRHDKIEADTMEYCIDISTGSK